MDAGSFLARWWNNIKPLPEEASRSAADIAQQRKQRRLIKGTIGLLILASAGFYIYNYIASAPERASEQLQAGMQKMQPGAYREAITHFDRAVSIMPQMADAYLERGIAHRFLGEAEPALADLDKALDLNPDLATAFNERGAIFQERGDTQKAIEELTKSIRVQPTTDGYYQRGQAYESLGEHRKAIEDFDEAVGQRREAPYVYRARALAKDKLGDTEGARQDRTAAESLEFSH